MRRLLSEDVSSSKPPMRAELGKIKSLYTCIIRFACSYVTADMTGGLAPGSQSIGAGGQGH